MIGVAFTLIAVWLRGLFELAAFKPYQLVISINYDVLWEDFKLSPAEIVPYEAFRFTAINAALFARSDDREYSSSLTLNKPIPLGSRAWAAGPGEFMDGPTFFIRPWHAGYQFGLTVQEEWWKRQSPQLNAAFRSLVRSYDGTVALGTLPAGYIADHIRRWHEPISLWYGFNRKQRRWKNRLNALGWSLSDDYPDHINHRYLSIVFRVL